jgi:hypothetical protein
MTATTPPPDAAPVLRIVRLHVTPGEGGRPGALTSFLEVDGAVIEVVAEIQRAVALDPGGGGAACDERPIDLGSYCSRIRAALNVALAERCAPAAVEPAIAVEETLQSLDGMEIAATLAGEHAESAVAADPVVALTAARDAALAQAASRAAQLQQCYDEIRQLQAIRTELVEALSAAQQRTAVAEQQVQASEALIQALRAGALDAEGQLCRLRADVAQADQAARMATGPAVEAVAASVLRASDVHVLRRLRYESADATGRGRWVAQAVDVLLYHGGRLPAPASFRDRPEPRKALQAARRAALAMLFAEWRLQGGAAWTQGIEQLRQVLESRGEIPWTDPRVALVALGLGGWAMLGGADAPATAQPLVDAPVPAASAVPVTGPPPATAPAVGAVAPTVGFMAPGPIVGPYL